MKRRTLIIVSILLLLSVALNLTGCTAKIRATNLMDAVRARPVTESDDLSLGNLKYSDFALRLFASAETSGENILVSPLSVLTALAMTANGAGGDTLAEMEEVLGMTKEELNLYIYSYMNSLPTGEKYKLSLANSIWFIDDDNFAANQNFLQTNADYYSADIYKAPFGNRTLKDINKWVKNKTDGMIPKVLDKISPDAVMFLVNALAFEAEWSDIYEKSQVRDGVFTKEDGEKQNVEFMYSTEGRYLEDELATGFVKYYSGGKYAFVALLPKEDVLVSDYVAYLDGEALHELLSNTENQSVRTSIPKFETEYSADISEILSSMGMVDAFNPDIADFQLLGRSSVGNIYINGVIHKTYISVGEKGTKAGAVTVVQMKNATAGDFGEKPKEVYLDRPFVYMLVDCTNNVPFFIGTMMDIDK